MQICAAASNQKNRYWLQKESETCHDVWHVALFADLCKKVIFLHHDDDEAQCVELKLNHSGQILLDVALHRQNAWIEASN